MFRFDWFQKEGSVTITIYVKNIKESSLLIDLCDERILSVIFDTDSGEQFSKVYDLFGKSSIGEKRLSQFKLEIVLHKKDKNIQWSSLEVGPQASSVGGPAYPTSSKKPIDLKSLESEADETPKNSEKELEAFLKNLYQGADEETRMAMTKSFVTLIIVFKSSIFLTYVDGIRWYRLEYELARGQGQDCGSFPA